MQKRTFVVFLQNLVKFLLWMKQSHGTEEIAFERPKHDLIKSAALCRRNEWTTM